MAAEAERKAKEKAQKFANAKPIDYPHLKKNPDSYKGEFVKYTGEIIQIMEDDNYSNIRIAVTKDSYGYNYDDVIYVEYPGVTDYVEGDVVSVWDISIPGMLAEKVSK
ncbi:hypothetical protein [Bacillus sp. UNCCL81]|uniref:hypothetical protein n=1 Tax=Bacillus sp. UNCCL81 TaxID=1502755 RepID=UPI0008E050BF|nr:hypothetical protein [Bacillus sp. UNCCL81]SFD34120.1 hypothetical protein SAMN02799633_03487 [Bacillus sp. UNCCL81]